ncbi:hypothetical protein M3Y94_01043800 [Aphelenchoides besseyi]|nr:hypothetical protein M3Y94_01043800 [Aphelenchoides besseyi]KAI6224022.1 hypothetical protein M3Y95_00839100 [Aphelenchoides besseyi]
MFPLTSTRLLLVTFVGCWFCCKSIASGLENPVGSNDQTKRSKRSLDFHPSSEMQISGISAIIIPIVIIVVCCFCLALFIALAVAHQHFEELRLAQTARPPTRSHVERHEPHEESSLMHAACQPSVVVMDHGHA